MATRSPRRCAIRNRSLTCSMGTAAYTARAMLRGQASHERVQQARFANVRDDVDNIARGIKVANAQPDNPGLATLNPIFTRVRVARGIRFCAHVAMRRCQTSS
jgi:hypothetical protein